MTASFAMFGCESYEPNQVAQQQHFICKSLIDGFLKTQNLGQYQLKQIQPTLAHSSAQRDYVYTNSSDHQIKLNMPQRHDLKFQCNQLSAQRFNVGLLDPNRGTLSPLMRIDLPPKEDINKFTAYVINKP